jgi:hypothetical protein
MDERGSETSAGVRNDGDVRAQRELQAEAEQRLEELRGRMRELNQRVVGFIRERPATAILIALGAGYLIGRILRS